MKTTMPLLDFCGKRQMTRRILRRDRKCIEKEERRGLKLQRRTAAENGQASEKRYTKRGCLNERRFL